MKRALIIGAGPAGSAAALALTRRGDVEVIMLERYPMPRTKVCGSGLSPWTLALLDHMGVGQQVRERAFAIDGAVIAGMRGEGVELRGDHETAVLLREEFDYMLVEEAIRRGAELRDGVRVTQILRHGGSAVGVKTRHDGVIEADAVIDCSGARGGFSWKTPAAGRLHTIMGWYAGVAQTSDVVEVFFDEAVRPHYGWLFPETARRVNIGICFAADADGPDARTRFADFVDRRLGPRLDGAEQLGGLVGHPVHTGWWPSRLVDRGVLIAGEAAQLVDAATAEGIYHALVSGLAAGEVLVDTFSEDAAPTPRRLARYPNLVRRRLAGRMLGGRLLMGALQTPALEAMLKLRRRPTIRKALARAFAGL